MMGAMGIATTLLVLVLGQNASEVTECDLADLFRGEDPNYPSSLVPCECEVHPALRALEGADAPADVERQWAAGDRRLVGVRGYAIAVPGVPDRGVAEQHGVRVLEVTTDAIGCFEHARLILIARDYAVAYNHALLARLQHSE